MAVEDRLVADAARLGVALSARAAAALLRYLELLAKWNRRFNLTAITDPDEMRVRHVLDSLSVVPFVAGTRILDVGSGAGLPGIPVALAEPKRGVTLLESRGRKVQFLVHVVAALDLSNVQIWHKRLDAVRPDDGEFDTVVARAFAPLPRLIERCAHLRRSGARLVAMTGKMPARPPRSVIPQIADIDIRSVRVPGLIAQRHVVVMTWA